jgi:hypothetical protein
MSAAVFKFPTSVLVNEVKRSMTTRTMTTGKKVTLVAKRMKSASGKTYVVLYSKKQFEREEKDSAKKTEKEAERIAKKEATQAERIAKKEATQAERIAKKEATQAERIAKKVAKK